MNPDAANAVLGTDAMERAVEVARFDGMNDAIGGGGEALQNGLVLFYGPGSVSSILTDAALQECGGGLLRARLACQ